LSDTLRGQQNPTQLRLCLHCGLSCGGFTPQPQLLAASHQMLNTKDPLDQRITIRLSRAEKDQLTEDANLAGLTTSELIRRRYFGKPIIAATDAAMIRELRRVGGLLKHIFNQSGNTYSTETGNALSEVKDCIKRLANRDS
jgi:hypothetical protein